MKIDQNTKIQHYINSSLKRSIYIWSLVLACTVCVLHIWFSKQKSSSSKRRFHWRILRGIFPVKTTRKWRHLFVWILLHCNFFIISYLLTEDCCKAWNFKYQNLVFSFLTCVIILLFPPIYMVIEHSFMNYSYTAKIYVYYICIYIYITEILFLFLFFVSFSFT